MRTVRHDDNYDAEFLVGRRSVLAASDLLDGLRKACGQEEDVLSSAHAFLANTTRWHSRPVAVLLGRAGHHRGAVLMHGGTIAGLPTGVLRSGHLCGRGTVIGPPAEQIGMIETASRLAIRTGLAHTVTARLLFSPHHGPADGGKPADRCTWSQRTAHSAVSLDGGWNGVRSRLSYKMRRNLSYYARKAEKEMGCVCRPMLTAMQSMEAVRALVAGRPRRQVRIALRYAQALIAAPHSVVLGLQDAQSRWLSFIAGWRIGDVFYVDLQINSIGHEATSISTVMRFFCLDHEISLGTRKVVFVGGTTEFWSRACQAEPCVDMILSGGLAGSLTRSLSAWLRPRGELADLHSRAAADPWSPVPDVASVGAGPSQPASGRMLSSTKG